MSIFTRSFGRLIQHSSETKTLLLKLSNRKLAAVCSSSTSTFKQSIVQTRMYSQTYFSYKDDSTEQQQQQQKRYEYLLVDVRGQNSNVALVQLNRPKTFNFLSDGLTKEVRVIFTNDMKLLMNIFQLAKVLESLDKDDRIGCIVLTGGTRAFAGKYPLFYQIDTLIILFQPVLISKKCKIRHCHRL